MSSTGEFSDHCFQGCSKCYEGAVADEFTPSCFEAGLLENNLKRRKDGIVPPWIVEGCRRSASAQFVEWFDDIWHTCEPSNFNEDIFTKQTVLIDPLMISKGAKQAADSFRLLFKCFPDLRGEVISWAANDREIFINWRFKIVQAGSGRVFLLPVVDKFGFKDGRVSWRLAYFDIIALLGYLSKVYGLHNLIKFLLQSSWQARKTAGKLLLPRMVWNLASGLVRWHRSPGPTNRVSDHRRRSS